MEHQFGVVESVQSRTFDPGSDRFSTPAACLLDDYVTDRRRRGKIERKSLAVKPVKNKLTVSGYARQYCDKEKNTYYYKTLEHIPQIYDTRNGQPQGKIVPERLFQTLVQAGQTPINGNFMRITGRSQAEDPRVRFNPADYMTNATTGQSEGFAQQKPVDSGRRTIFGQDVVPPNSGQDPSKPSGSNPGVPPLPPGGPSGSNDDVDDDDDDTSSGGGGKTGLFDTVSKWYVTLKEQLGQRMQTPNQGAVVPYEPPPSTEGALVPYEPKPSTDGALVPYTAPRQGTVSLTPELQDLVRQTPVEQFAPTPTLRRSGRSRNTLYPDLNENNMAVQAFSVTGDDYGMNYRPSGSGPAIPAPRINPRNPDIRYMLDDHPSVMPNTKNNGDDDDNMPLNMLSGKLKEADDNTPLAKLQVDKYQSSRGNYLTEEQLQMYMEKFSAEFTDEMKQIVKNIKNKGEVDAEDVAKIQNTWYSGVRQVGKSIKNNNVVAFFAGINTMRNAFNGMVFIGQLVGLSGLSYLVYRGYTNARDTATEAFGTARDFTENMALYISGKRPPKYRISRNDARKMIDSSESEQTVLKQIEELGMLFGEGIDLNDVLSVDDIDRMDPAWTMNTRAYGQPGADANMALGSELVRQGKLKQEGWGELTPQDVQYLKSKMASDPNMARRNIANNTRGSDAQNAAIIAGVAAALYMGPAIYRRLARKFMRSAGQPLPDLPRTSNLADQSRNIQNVAESSRSSGRKRKQIYASLNEREMSQKAGKQKMYTEDGI